MLAASRVGKKTSLVHGFKGPKNRYPMSLTRALFLSAARFDYTRTDTPTL
jgi:hypothetical protein